MVPIIVYISREATATLCAYSPYVYNIHSYIVNYVQERIISHKISQKNKYKLYIVYSNHKQFKINTIYFNNHCHFLFS